eukprot:GHVH01016178.1.p1 GENE.GHVH01016178.1~~GHVH01016178.1.p1  ORF type:complete len:590 (+),score=86.33 GHVH01016178.1:106-1875(+)
MPVNTMPQSTAFDVELLKDPKYDQAHLLEGFDSWNEEQKSNLANDLQLCDASYPGGIMNYRERARKFLAAAATGENPFEGMEPYVPLTAKLEPGTVEFEALEKKGLDAVKGMAFVLVAGGLGERLGYDGIKVSLPTECTTMTCYLKHYCEYIIAFQASASKRSGELIISPFAIMTSDDTYAKTLELLESNDYFGLAKDQVTMMKQEKVPALIDAEAHIAQDKQSKHLEMKPHGHGDVHQLLVSHGLPAKWIAQGKTHMIFFQDTNALVFRCLPAALGFSVQHQLVMNTICIPRKAGEAVGGICKLVNKETKKELTLNVEYNQLGPLLKACGYAGDVADPATGHSSYPGNTNALLFNLSRYNSVMEETGGNIPEFVNPKYSDSTMTSFKSPTRLECMMQEFPRLLSNQDPVGCVEAPRFICFSTVKNHYTDAAKKVESGGVPECAFSGESDIYASNVELLKIAAKSQGCTVDIEDPVETTWLGVTYPIGPRVILKPSFGVCLTEIKERIVRGSHLKITHDSTLIVEGDCLINGLELDGTMKIRGSAGKPCCINNTVKKNEKCKMVPVAEKDPLPLKIRGYKVQVPESIEI